MLRFVALVASKALMATQKWKICPLVIECFLIKVDNVRLATSVVRVTMTAFLCTNFITATVKPGFGLDIFGNLLMAIQAQGPLIFFGK